jgi:pimeloyl-ACP methyl ester carboxylesterase
MTALQWIVPALVLPCTLAAPPQTERPRPGVVFVVDGIGGLNPLGRWARVALPLAGVPHEVRPFHWTHGVLRPLRDLQDTRHLIERAAALADEVLRVKAEDPDRPIYLIGHSAGAALVLIAAGRLPDATLERVVLLSAAVSPTFDLTGALKATRGEVVSYSSACDWFYLWWGTSQFGTADRTYGPSAGLGGFVPPDGLDEEGRALYARLVQRPWQPQALLECRGGGHTSTTAPWFLARHVAPWLRPAPREPAWRARAGAATVANDDP